MNHEGSTGTRALAWLNIVVLNWALLTSVIIYFGRLFYLKRKHTAIERRYKIGVLWFNAVLILYISVVHPLRIIYYARALGHFCHSLAYRIVFALSHSIATRGIMVTTLVRAWALYYDACFTVAHEKGKWIRAINPKTFENDLFLGKKNTLGNERWMITRVWMPIYIVIVIVSTVTRVKSSNAGLLLDIGVYAAFLIPLGVIWKKIPAFEHHLCIETELSFIWKVGMVFMTFMFVKVGIQRIDDSTTMTILLWILSDIFSIIATVGALVTTFWVLFRSGIDFTYYGRVSSTQGSHNRAFSIELSPVASETNPESPRSINIGLRTVLTNKQTFELFMHRCFSEFSGENLLCVLELVQFQQLIAPDSNSETRLQMPSDSDFVKSAIVFNDNLSNAAKAEALIEKYICNGSELEVNISYSCRSEIAQLLTVDRDRFDTMSDSELADIFDSVIDEVYRVMRDTFGVWRRTADFEKAMSEVGIFPDTVVSGRTGFSTSQM